MTSRLIKKLIKELRDGFNGISDDVASLPWNIKHRPYMTRLLSFRLVDLIS